MVVEDVRRLVDLLNESTFVTELTVQGASGSKVTLKRLHNAPASQSLPSMLLDDPESIDAESIPSDEVKPRANIGAMLVGKFREASPPVSSGTSVVVGQIVGYIESMGLMNEVISTVSGEVAAATTSEGQPVEYGQPLFSVLV